MRYSINRAHRETGPNRNSQLNKRRVAIAIIAAAWLATFGVFSHSRAGEPTQYSTMPEATPWDISDLADPTAPSDASNYLVDPGFHDGEYIEDAFGANQNDPTNYFLGRKVAKLPDGDIVVAALVKNPNGNQTNGFWNVGLVRYSSDGSARRPWANAGNFGSSDNQYVVYPKTDTASFSWIQDIKVIGNFILVSTNLNYDGTADIDTYVLVFDLDGHFYRALSVFGSTAYEYIGGMEVYSSGGIGAVTNNVVVASTIVPSGGGIGRPIFKRLTLNDDGTLTDETGVVAINVAGCANPADDCEAKAIALGYPGVLGLSPSIFIATVRRVGGTSAEANIAVLDVNSNGDAVSSWNATAWNTSPGGDRADIPFGIAVKSTGLGLPNSPRVYTVYVASYIDRACKSGVSVLRQSTADNGASAQTSNYGGSDADPGVLCTLLRRQDLGNGVTMQDGKLAIAGYQVAHNIGASEDEIDAEVAIFDDLTLTSIATYPYPINGPRDRHTGFFGVVGTGDGKFVATGDDRFRNADDVPASLRGKQSVAVLGLAPDDAIFDNGFE